MFLALVLSVMAVGSASANDGDRRPAGVSFGLGGNNGFVVVDVRAAHDGRWCREFAVACRPHGKCDCHHGRGKKAPRPPKPNPHGKHHGKHHDKHHDIHHGKPHGRPHSGPGGDRPNGPGMPPPPPGRR